MTQMLDTGTVADSIRSEVQEVLQEILVELDAARRDQRRKDTPAARLRVRRNLERVDAVLDVWNDARHAHG